MRTGIRLESSIGRNGMSLSRRGQSWAEFAPGLAEATSCWSNTHTHTPHLVDRVLSRGLACPSALTNGSHVGAGRPDRRRHLRASGSGTVTGGTVAGTGRIALAKGEASNIEAALVVGSACEARGEGAEGTLLSRAGVGGRGDEMSVAAGCAIRRLVVPRHRAARRCDAGEPACERHAGRLVRASFGSVAVPPQGMRCKRW